MDTKLIVLVEGQRLSIGTVIVNESLAEIDIIPFVTAHARGEWDDLTPAHRRKSNESSLSAAPLTTFRRDEGRPECVIASTEPPVSFGYAHQSWRVESYWRLQDDVYFNLRTEVQDVSWKDYTWEELDITFTYASRLTRKEYEDEIAESIENWKSDQELQSEIEQMKSKAQQD